MEINEKLIRFSSKAPVPHLKELAMDDDVEFTVKGTVTKVSEGSNQDGTKDVTYIVKVTEIL